MGSLRLVVDLVVRVGIAMATDQYRARAAELLAQSKLEPDEDTAAMLEAVATCFQQLADMLIYADERLYLYSEDGVVGLAEASPAGYREHGRFTVPNRSDLPTWSHPVISGGLLILRDQDVVHAYDVRLK